MLPWNKKFLEHQDNIKPKTILSGSDGQDIKEVAREIAKAFITRIDGKDYKNLELENIASHNFYFLKNISRGLSNLKRVKVASIEKKLKSSSYLLNNSR